MVNHLRTLLLNLAGVGFEAGEGGEYSDPLYRPVLVGRGPQLVRNALFGAAPDERTLRYRVRQLLSLVHAGGLAPFALEYDPRITYLPLARGVLDFLPSTSATPLGHAYSMTVEGTPVEDPRGRSSGSYLVELVDV